MTYFLRVSCTYLRLAPAEWKSWRDFRDGDSIVKIESLVSKKQLNFSHSHSFILFDEKKKNKTDVVSTVLTSEKVCASEVVASWER